MAEAKIDIVLSNGAKAGTTLKELTKDANKLNKELKDLKPGTEEFIAKSKDLQAVSGRINDIKSQIKGTTEASNGLKNAFAQFVPFGGIFSQLGQNLGVAKSGVGGLISSMGMLRGAIISTGIGAFLVVIGLLINALSKFTPIIDKVEQIMSGLSAVMQEVTQRFQNFAAGLWDVVTGAPGGVDKLASSFDGLGDSITKAYDAGVQLKMLQQDLEDLNRGIAITNAEQERQVDRLLLQSKNRALSTQEQIELLQKAKDVAIENYKINIDLSKKNLDALLIEAQQSSKLSKDEILQLAEGTLAQEVEYDKRGTLSDELLQKITDAQVAVINGEGKTNNLMEKIANRESSIREKQEAEREKALAAELKRKEKLAKAEEDRLKREEQAARNIEDLRVEIMADGVDQEIARINLDTERKILALQGSEAQITEQAQLLEEERQQDIQDVKDKFALQAAEKDKKAKDDQAKRNKEAAEEAKRIAKDKHEFEMNLQQSQEDNALGVFQLGTELAAKTVKNEEAARKIRKIGALAEIGLNLQRELSQNAILAGQTASAAGPAAIGVFAGSLTALNIQSFLRAGLAAAKVLLFRKGGVPGIEDGVLRGPSHEQGGIPLVAEGREIILAKGVYDNPKLRRAASALNVAGGGRAFAAGGPVSPFNSRGPIASGSAQGGSPSVAQMENLEKYLIANLDAINNRIDNIKVTNVVGETDAGIQVLNRIKADANT
jgi:hypothetical protein